MLIGARAFGRVALVAMLAAVGCHAQTPSQPAGAAAVQAGVKLPPELARRVEVMIRSKSSITLDYTMSFGLPTASEVPGYDQVVATFSAPGASPRTATFLLSSDGKTLAQFNKLDLSQDPRDKVSLAGRPARGGSPNAPVRIVVFDDLQCPFCAELYTEMFPAIQKRYGDQVRIVYRDFPLEQHLWAMHAAVDANCLGSQTTEGYWDFVDYVHTHVTDFPGEEKSLTKSTQALDKLTLDEGTRQKVNQPDLVACVLKQDTSKVKASVDEALKDPLSLGSAPVLFINGEEVVGAQPIDIIDEVIDRALIAEGQTPPPAPAKPAAPASPAAPAPAKPGN